MKKELLAIFCLLLLFHNLSADSITKKKEANLNDLSSCTGNTQVPFKAKGDFFSVWDGRDYTQLFIKGINLGIAIPGTQPGELAASREQYRKWFKEIKETGFNCIRLYTLHFPRFYEELQAYNFEHPESPLLVFQGIWLDELSDLNLYNQTSAFEQEIGYAVDCAHGNKTISSRLGKAYGSYTADISPWVVGYIIGREVHPPEIEVTNSNNTGATSYNGNYLSISSCSPAEAWITARMDKVITYEHTNYETQRPVSFSSWPTLDPLTHPTEEFRYNGLEDSEQIDFAKIDGTDADAGFFVSYHAYPYYPDFISDEPSYQTEQDTFGPNSYLGYLKDLKAHYENIPLIIAEFGVPTSWGIAHYAHSKMNHGGVSEEMQGKYSIRMLDNMREAMLGGGIQFSWIDEWFKQTWITNPFSNADTRYVWHNLTAPEQNFGLVSFVHKPMTKTSIGSYTTSSIKNIKASADPTYFNVTLITKTEGHLSDDYWVAIDTHDKEAGESILPNGQSITTGGKTLRAEFALKFNLSDTIAKLYVTKDYDNFNIKQTTRLDTVISTRTDGAPWEVVRWRTNYAKNNIQYIGEIKIEHGNKPYSFLNGLSWNSDSINIRLPWTLINFRDPSQKEVMHYTSEWVNGAINVLTTDKVSDGIALTVVHQNEKVQSSRFSWANWGGRDIIDNPPLERQKKSVLYIKEHIKEFNSAPLAECDSYLVKANNLLEVDASNGLLSNDLDYDGDQLEVVQPLGYTTLKGNLFVHPDGSFVYEPAPLATGEDEFMYYATDGTKYSKLVTVKIQIKDNNMGTAVDELALNNEFRVYPNPGNGLYQVRITGNSLAINNLMIYNSTGQLVKQINHLDDGSQIDLSDQEAGIFYFKYLDNETQKVNRVIKF